MEIVVPGNFRRRPRWREGGQEWLAASPGLVTTQVEVWGLRIDHAYPVAAARLPIPVRVLHAAGEHGSPLTSATADLAVNADLHHDQMLAATREPWLCVDPRLLRGDIEDTSPACCGRGWARWPTMRRFAATSPPPWTQVAWTPTGRIRP